MRLFFLILEENAYSVSQRYFSQIDFPFSMLFTIAIRFYQAQFELFMTFLSQDIEFQGMVSRILIYVSKLINFDGPSSKHHISGYKCRKLKLGFIELYCNTE